jgi:hypothetical protein
LASVSMAIFHFPFLTPSQESWPLQSDMFWVIAMTHKHSCLNKHHAPLKAKKMLLLQAIISQENNKTSLESSMSYIFKIS